MRAPKRQEPSSRGRRAALAALGGAFVGLVCLALRASALRVGAGGGPAVELAPSVLILGDFDWTGGRCASA
jgi:hypothetical protein